MAIDIERLSREDLLREKLRRMKYDMYRRFPLKWAQEVMGKSPENFKWSLHKGYENHVWDGSKDPISSAWECLAKGYEDENGKWVSKGEWASITAATGTGKTHTLAYIALWFLDCFENSLVITSAPKEEQLKLNLWGEINTLVNDFKLVRPNSVLTSLKLKAEGANASSPYNDTHQMIGFVAGSGAEEDSANKARGFHRKNMLIIFEETPGMNSAIITAFKNTCTGDNNLILAVGNPDNEYDQLYRFSNLPNVNAFRVSAFDYPNVVLGREVYAGAVTRGSIERRRAEFKTEDNPQWLSSVRGITPKNDLFSLIKTDWVEEAYVRSSKFKNKILEDGYNSCGVDVAQSQNGDEASTAFFVSNVLKAIYEFPCSNATDLAYNLILDDMELASRGMNIYECGKLADFDVMPQCIGVDTVGVGAATLNAFNEYGMNVISLSGGAWSEAIPIETDDKGKEKPAYKFANLRSQMYYEARLDFQNGNIVIDIDEAIYERLKKELCGIRWEKNDNAIAIEKKSDIKRRMGGKSPNLADAFVYANWARKGYRLFGGAMPLAFGVARL